MKARYALLIPVLGTLLVGCNVNHKELEAAITKKAKDEGVELKKVECPERKMKKGDTFDCKATDDDDDDVVFNVEQTDSAGSVSFKLVGTILDTEKVGDGIEEKIGKGADVKCPSRKTVLVDGKKVKCKVSIDGKDHDLQLIAKGDEGMVNWKILD